MKRFFLYKIVHKKSLTLVLVLLITLPFLVSQRAVASPLLGFPKMKVDIYGSDVLTSNSLKKGGSGIVYIEAGLSDTNSFTGFVLVRLPKFLEPVWMTAENEVVAYLDVSTVGWEGTSYSYEHSELQDSLINIDMYGGRWFLLGIESSNVPELLGPEQACLAAISIGVKFTDLAKRDEIEAFIVPFSPKSIEEARFAVAKSIIEWGIKEIIVDQIQKHTIEKIIPFPYSLILNLDSIAQVFGIITGEIAQYKKLQIEILTETEWETAYSGGTPVRDAPSAEIQHTEWIDPSRFSELKNYFSDISAKVTGPDTFKKDDTLTITISGQMMQKYEEQAVFARLMIPTILEFGSGEEPTQIYKSIYAGGSPPAPFQKDFSMSWTLTAKNDGSLGLNPINARVVMMTPIGWTGWPYVSPKAYAPIAWTKRISTPADFQVSMMAAKELFSSGETAQLKITFLNSRASLTSFSPSVHFKDPEGESAKYDSQISNVPSLITLEPNKETTIDAQWAIPNDTPSGQYEIDINCWKDGSHTERYSDDLLWSPVFRVIDGLSNAIVVNKESIISTSKQGDSSAFHVFISPVGFLTATDEDTFLIMSTGIAENIPGSPEDFESTDFGSEGTADDAVHLTLRLLVPNGANTLSFDFRFMSEEYPEYVGSEYNDFFYAYLTDSTGTHQVAFDDDGNIITINNNFFNPNIYPIGTVFDGATKRLTTTVNVNEGEEVTLQFEVGDAGDGIFDTAVFLDNVRFNVGGGPGTTPTADVIVVKNSPNSVEQGKQFTYTINYFNIEEAAAQNVIVTDNLPSQVAFVSASAGGTYSSITHSVTWNLGTLQPFSSGSLTLTVSVPSTVPIGAVLSNSASVSTTSQESNSNNNQLTKTTTVIAGTSLPPNVEVGPTTSNYNGIPVLYWTTPTTFTFHGDANVIGVDINIHLPDGGPDIGGPITNVPGTYDWAFTYEFYPRHGQGTVTYTVHYSDGQQSTTAHSILVDPSGYVYNAVTEQRIQGATVTLYRFDIVLQQFVLIAPDDPGIEPHINPQITDENGGYGWMVSPGIYMVEVEKEGYESNFATVTVPPPTTDLNVPLTPMDITPPTTEIVIGQPNYVDTSGHTYVTSTTTFKLVADDGPDGLGVAATYYRYCNATAPPPDWTHYSQFFYLHGPEDSKYSIYFYSTDVIDNAETLNVQEVILDNTPPTTTLAIGEPKYISDIAYVTPGTPFTLEATDAGSGIYSIAYRITNATYVSNWQPYMEPFNLTTLSEGNYTIAYRSTDLVGNNETEHMQETVLARTFPAGSIAINDDATYTNSTSVTLTLTNPNVADIQQIRYSNDGVWNTEQWEDPIPIRTWDLTVGDGNKAVHCQIKDRLGLISPTFQDSIILDTTRPTTNAGTDQTGNEDTPVAFNASASTDENGITTYVWTFADGTPQELDGKNPTYTFTTPGTYIVTLRVTDPAGNDQTSNVTITVRDVTRPVAEAGQDRTVNEDTSITLDGSASSDNVDVTTFTWTFTDGTSKTLNEEITQYTFNTPGAYTVTLNVTDAAGNWATDTATITVLDITKPVANAGHNQTTSVGSNVSFDASASSDNVGIVSYEWDFGDGTTSTGIIANHTYTSSGEYTVSLTVRDEANNTDTNQIKVTAESGRTVVVVIAAIATIIVLTMVATSLILWKKRK